jgi:hypothetical protein
VCVFGRAAGEGERDGRERTHVACTSLDSWREQSFLSCAVVHHVPHLNFHNIVRCLVLPRDVGHLIAPQQMGSRRTWRRQRMHAQKGCVLCGWCGVWCRPLQGDFVFSCDTRRVRLCGGAHLDFHRFGVVGRELATLQHSVRAAVAGGRRCWVSRDLARHTGRTVMARPQVEQPSAINATCG